MGSIIPALILATIDLTHLYSLDELPYIVAQSMLGNQECYILGVRFTMHVGDSTRLRVHYDRR